MGLLGEPESIYEPEPPEGIPTRMKPSLERQKCGGTPEVPLSPDSPEATPTGEDAPLVELSTHVC